MRHTLLLIFLIVLYVSSNAQTTTLKKLVDNVSETSLKLNLYKIAGNEFEGRMAASKGDSLAIRFIANWFNTNHLNNPYKTTTPYLQHVPLVHSDYSTSSFSVDGKLFELDKQWTYNEGSKGVEFTNIEVLFIGYGISLPRFDELKDMDIEGKFVIFQDSFPTDSNGKNLIPEKEKEDEEQQLFDKVVNKKPAGFLDYIPQFKDWMKQRNEFRNFNLYRIYKKEEMPPLNGYHISSDIANYLVGNVDSIYSLINTSGKPHSFNTGKKVTISMHKNEEKVNTDNIVGILIGSNEKLPCIVVTAHHDHEGKVNGATYFGADDNGSGTTALLEIIKVLGDANKGIRPKRTIVFVSTGAEEQGLYGSKYYVEHPVIPLSKTYCNINIDMLGRVDSFYTGKKADSNYVYCMYYDTTNTIFTSKKLQSINNPIAV